MILSSRGRYGQRLAEIATSRSVWLIAAPLQGRSRENGTSVFLDLGTMEAYEEQSEYLSTLSRM
ncbi:MAG TPA: hypothetical protein VHN80_18300, partial [Kineosporiaceae bacterium]|nr:hypothetical protein [Kineosporiaceae bacterium]